MVRPIVATFNSQRAPHVPDFDLLQARSAPLPSRTPDGLVGSPRLLPGTLLPPALLPPYTAARRLEPLRLRLRGAGRYPDAKKPATITSLQTPPKNRRASCHGAMPQQEALLIPRLFPETATSGGSGRAGHRPGPFLDKHPLMTGRPAVPGRWITEQPVKRRGTLSRFFRCQPIIYPTPLQDTAISARIRR